MPMKLKERKNIIILLEIKINYEILLPCLTTSCTQPFVIILVIQRSSRKIFTAHYLCRNADVNLTPIMGMTKGFIFQVINS